MNHRGEQGDLVSGERARLGVRFGSISGKITLIVFGVSMALTALGSLFYIMTDLSTLRATMARDSTLLAEVLARNSTASLAFEDPGAGATLLRALAVRPQVISAQILDADGAPFAAYVREGADVEATEPHAWLTAGHHFDAESLDVHVPVLLDGRRLGWMTIRSDLRLIDARKRSYVAAGGLIAVGAIVVAIVLTALLRRWISRPIEDLADLARRVSEEKRFDLRAPRTSADEVGDLVDAFNDMLSQIEQRDVELVIAKGQAEEAAVRLSALLDVSHETNDQLEVEIVEHERAERELRVKSRELERSNIELDQFAYVASHDLQEPLRMVTMFTQLLKRRYGPALDASANEYIDYAVDGAGRMRHLIQDLLDYSRAGRSARAFEPVALDRILEQVTGALRVAITESGGRVDVGPMPTLDGNPTRLFQLFQNLVSNAIKFRRAEAPEVRIDAEREGDRWHFRVRDNGIGIDPAFRERIFMVFQRLHTRDEYEGTGIGLALCKRIVEVHGGEIRVEDHTGPGATFHFTLLAEHPAPDGEGAGKPERDVRAGEVGGRR